MPTASTRRRADDRDRPMVPTETRRDMAQELPPPDDNGEAHDNECLVNHCLLDHPEVQQLVSGDPAGNERGPIDDATAHVGFGFTAIVGIIRQYPELQHGFIVHTNQGHVHGFYSPLGLALDAPSHWGLEPS